MVVFNVCVSLLTVWTVAHRGTLRKDIKMVTSGCMGRCDTEPNVSIAMEGSEAVVYKKMDPVKIRQVFRKHVLEGEIQQEFVLTDA